MNTTICDFNWDHGFPSLYPRTLWSRAWRETDYNTLSPCHALDKVKYLKNLFNKKKYSSIKWEKLIQKYLSRYYGQLRNFSILIGPIDQNDQYFNFLHFYSLSFIFTIIHYLSSRLKPRIIEGSFFFKGFPYFCRTLFFLFIKFPWIWP